MLREHAGGADNRHEVSVTLPARHYMPVQMLGKSGSGDLAQVGADVKPRRLQHRSQTLNRTSDQLGHGSAFLTAQELGRSHVSTRCDHQVAVVIRITIK